MSLESLYLCFKKLTSSNIKHSLVFECDGSVSEDGFAICPCTADISNHVRPGTRYSVNASE